MKYTKQGIPWSSEDRKICLRALKEKERKNIIKKWKDIINPFNNFKTQDIGTMVKKNKIINMGKDN